MVIFLSVTLSIISTSHLGLCTWKPTINNKSHIKLLGDKRDGWFIGNDCTVLCSIQKYHQVPFTPVPHSFCNGFFIVVADVDVVVYPTTPSFPPVPYQVSISSSSNTILSHIPSWHRPYIPLESMRSSIFVTRSHRGTVGFFSGRYRSMQCSFPLISWFFYCLCFGKTGQIDRQRGKKRRLRRVNYL